MHGRRAGEGRWENRQIGGREEGLALQVRKWGRKGREEGGMRGWHYSCGRGSSADASGLGL